MKRIRLLVVMLLMAVMLIGSTLTTHAAITGARATRFGITTNEGNYIAFNDMVVASGYGGILENYQTDAYAEYNNYAMWHYSDDKEEYYVVVFAKDGTSLKYSPYESGGKYWPRLQGTTSLIICYNVRHTFSDDVWKVSPSSSVSYQANLGFYGNYDLTDPEQAKAWMRSVICYTTADILDTDGTTVFFQAPKVILNPIIAEVPMMGATQEIMKVLPICLGLLVSYLALRKGLQVLQVLLRQA